MGMENNILVHRKQEQTGSIIYKLESSLISFFLLQQFVTNALDYNGVMKMTIENQEKAKKKKKKIRIPE